MRVLILVLALCSLIACKKSPPTEPPVSSSFDERQACAADADCAAVELACCDHCNGGTVVGVHRDHATDVRNEYAPASACGSTGCTKRGCSEAVPICRQGRCGVSIDSVESLPDLRPATAP